MSLPLDPVKVVVELQEQTNLIINIFEQMARLQQKEPAAKDELVNKLEFLIEKDNTTKVVHPRIIAELTRLYNHFKPGHISMPPPAKFHKRY